VIRSLAARRDWFVADRATLEGIFEVPGILPGKFGDYEIHRSHLPLIQSNEAARIRDELRVRPLEWERRNHATAPLGFTLKTVQHQGVDFICSRRGTLLADEMRVGKTLTAAYSHDPTMGQLVVIAPLIARQVWLGWLRRIWPGEEIGIMQGREYDPKEASKPLVIGHYDIIYNWQSGRKIGTLIFDEAHALTNPKSRRTRAAVMLQSCAERVIAATGSPIYNMPTNLWSVLGLVAPGAWGGYHDFCMRYAAPEATDHGFEYTGISNGEELAERLTEVMIRRKWADVQKDLPPITRNVMIVDLDNRERRKLDIETERMRQSKTTNTAASLARYRDALALVKVPATVAEAEKVLRQGIPLVVWSYHLDAAEQLVEQLAQAGHDALLVTGEVAPHRRDAILDHWRSLPNAALVISMAVGQVAIDLSHSTEAIFAEIDYTPLMISQAEMRTFAPTRGMHVTYMVADHYIDRKIADALARKLEAAEPVNLGTGDGAISAISSAFRGPEQIADMQRFMDDLLAG
jgi:SNF2 family DNA or RNA helicase